MAVQVIYGETRNRAIANQLADAVSAVTDSGTVYLGYPVLASADDRVFVDALAVLPEHGLVAFQLADRTPGTEEDWGLVIEEQDRLWGALSSHLSRNPDLLDRRQLAFEIETVTVFPADVGPPPGDSQGHYCSLDEVGPLVAGFDGIVEERLHALQAALQRVSTIKPAKRRAAVERADSRGAVLKAIEREIANLDQWQKRAAIEMPEGPQRIRGLAGSGKTIVLALKAAYLHAQHPDWTIAVTFQTRALYQQFEDLIRRFTFEHSHDLPDFSKLQIIHAWGSSSREGVYSGIARHLGHAIRDWNYAASVYGSTGAFEGICEELLDLSEASDAAALWDAVLIDEAQDLPPAFFQLVHRFTDEPHRVVWAYDELQKLSEAAMPSTEELFGLDANNHPRVTLVNRDGEARQDIILEVCYRNTPWALASAHAVGFGIYRADGLVQHFDDPGLWEEIGYEVVAGTLRAGDQVTLRRSRGSYPSYFSQLIRPGDSVQHQVFGSEAAHDEWIAGEIARNLADDELEHDDFLVVIPNVYTAKRRSSRFRRVLDRHGVSSHVAGVHTSVDEVFLPGSIAIAHIHRAKGNEAPMVYVMDAQYGVGEPNSVTRRNTLFTAMTRSKAWLRVCSWGDDADPIRNELDSVVAGEYQLIFPVPTADELAQMRRIHRDRTEAEVESLRRARQGLREVIDALERDDVDLEDLDPELRTRLTQLFLDEGDNGNHG